MKAREKAREKWHTTMREEVICERCGRTLKGPDLFNRPGGWATVGVWQDEDEPERKKAYGHTFDLCDGCLATIREEFETHKKRIGASTSATLEHVVEEARVHLKPSEDEPASGAFLHAYLALENVMFTLDEEGDETRADMLRDALDPVWRCLSADDHRLLNARGMITTKEDLRRGLESRLHPKPPAAACVCEELRRLASALDEAEKAATRAFELWTALGEDVWRSGGHVYGGIAEDGFATGFATPYGDAMWNGKPAVAISVDMENIEQGRARRAGGVWKRDEILVRRLDLALASVRYADAEVERLGRRRDEIIGKLADRTP